MEEKLIDTLNIKLKPPVVAANLCLNESVHVSGWLIEEPSKRLVIQSKMWLYSATT